GGEEVRTRRREPQRTEHDEDEMHGCPRNAPQDLRGDGFAPGGELDRRGCGGHQTSLLNRRTLSARTGITSANRNTAIAEPSPKLFSGNAVRHIASAITFAFCCVDSGANAS